MTIHDMVDKQYLTLGVTGGQWLVYRKKPNSKIKDIIGILILFADLAKKSNFGNDQLLVLIIQLLHMYIL